MQIDLHVIMYVRIRAQNCSCDYDQIQKIRSRLRVDSMQKMKSITDSKYEDHIQIYTIADRELSESPTTSRAALSSSDHIDHQTTSQ